MSEPHAATALHRLLTIMTRLFDPQEGCPWDKARLLIPSPLCTLEETYEVLDAIAGTTLHRAQWERLKAQERAENPARRRWTTSSPRCRR